MPHPNPIIVAGVGNLLLTDDGAGVHAVRELQKTPMEGVCFLEIGAAILHGLPFLESARRLLIIDAVMGGQPPGTLYLFESDKPREEEAVVSLHALGLCSAFRLLYPGKKPPPTTILGVEPVSLELGMELSPALRHALPKVTALARKIANAWIDDEDPLFAGWEQSKWEFALRD